MRTSGLGRFTLGQPLPARSHAVCVSLPKMEDVIGYEEKDPATLRLMPTGYPRFVRHQMINRMIEHLNIDPGNKTFGYLFARKEDGDEVVSRYQLSGVETINTASWTLLKVPRSMPQNSLIASHFQHTGCGISSRLAEDYLWDHGMLEKREILSDIVNPDSIIRETISRAHGPEVSPDDLLLASSGANAFHALFKAACGQAKERKKDIWIRWGWLYLDTIEVMNLYGKEQGDVIEVNGVGQTDQLKSIFVNYGDRIAGLITEFPTNPLLQAGDLETVRSLCDQAQALLVVDPTMVSPKNAKITHLADVVVNSLTKYAGWEGDVMMGSLAFPRCSRLGRELFQKAQQFICPPYSSDLVRMAEQIPYYDNFINRANVNALEVAEFLQRHHRVKKVHWAYQPGYGKNYEKFAGENRPGCNVSFEINGNYHDFYNRLQMLKSPSFGTEFSNCCPYVYLAHYPLIKSEEGKHILEEAGISPHLLRLSVGLEPVDQIIQTIDDALQ